VNHIEYLSPSASICDPWLYSCQEAPGKPLIVFKISIKSSQCREFQAVGAATRKVREENTAVTYGLCSSKTEAERLAILEVVVL